MTGGIRIPIGADLSGVKQAVDDLAQGAKDALGQDLNAKGIDKVVDQMGAATKVVDKLAEGLGKAAGSAKDVEKSLGGAGNKASAGMGKAAADAKKLADELAKAQRVKAALDKLGHKMNATQAGEFSKDYEYWRDNSTSPAMRKKLAGVSFASLSGGAWRTLGANEVAARRQFNDILRHLGLNQSNQPQQPPQQNFQGFMGELLRRGGGGVGGALMAGTGTGGAIAQAALSGAANTPDGALSGAGLARIAGGLGLATVAYGAIKGIQATRAHLGNAEGEGVGYADMLRQMGATSTTFDLLRNSVRAASQEIDVTFGEGSKLASAYLRTSGADGISTIDLQNELGNAGGAARALGLDPEAGVGFFGQLRHSKVSSGDSDNKRFALMIGEAVARAGVFTKADEVLAAVAGYTKTATSAALMPANATGYIGAMGSLLNEHRAGMDPSGAASMLGTIDASMRHGGGEAQRNFLLGALQNSMPGITAVDMGFMQDAGMFGTAKQVFGQGSTAYAAADAATQARYDKLAAAGGDRTFFDMAMQQMGGMSGDLQRKNIMGLFGLSDSQAALLQKVTAERGGSLSDTIKGVGEKYGVDSSKLNGTSLRNVLDIEYGDPAQLRSKAAWFKAQGISDEDRANVDRALDEPGTDDAALKRTLMQLAPKYSTEMTEGDITRKNMASMENLATDVASKLIPATNAIRDAVVAIAGWIPGLNYKEVVANTAKSSDALDANLSKVKPDDILGRVSVYAAEADRINHNPNQYTEEYKRRVQKEAQSAADKIDPTPRTQDGKVGTEQFSGDPDEFIRKTRKAAEIAAARVGGNVKPEWLQGQWAIETGWGKSMLKGTNNLGNIKGARTWDGKKAPIFNVPEQRRDGSVYREDAAFRTYANLEDFGDDAGRLLSSPLRYYGVSQAKTPKDFAQALKDNNYASDHGYAAKVADAIRSVEKRSAKFGATPLPAGAPAPGTAASATGGGTANHTVDVYLRDPRTGAQLAEPARVNTGAAPRPAGVR